MKHRREVASKELLALLFPHKDRHQACSGEGIRDEPGAQFPQGYKTDDFLHEPYSLHTHPSLSSSAGFIAQRE